ncbi:transposase family protein [Lujinxingia vulgaris]|uniref:Transposase family protein n=1 Tax=Lujinxingia vulgaris TaxID=2600176 RepID=A0A5C6XAI8_9DELT|nr:transposase family protein [Lujinxingia vulgaris]
MLRTDNHAAFTSKALTGGSNQYGLIWKRISPWMPLRNGLIERVFRSLKESASG